MSRWDDSNFENYTYDETSEHEEARLIKKFEDYQELEKKELEKRQPPKASNKEKTGVWTSRFIFLTVIQAIIIAGCTVSLMFMEFINSDIKILVLLLTLGVLTGEIMFLSKYFQNKSSLQCKKSSSVQFETKTEFDGI